MKILFPFSAATTRGVKRKRRDEAEAEESSSRDENPKKRYKTRAYRRRKREMSNATPPKQDPADYQPDCQFYPSDADLIILSGKIMFGVHAEKMRKAGGIFEDLLSSPEINAQAEDMLFDLPCIEVPLITTRQLRFLIACLYDKIHLHKLLPDGRSWVYWEAAVALLQVSKIYDLEHVRVDAIAALEYILPTSGKPSHHKAIIAGLRPKDNNRFLRFFALQAINLCHECEIPAMLPMAYYHAAQCSIEDIVYGVEDNHGKLVTLERKDVITVLNGRDKLQGARRRFLDCIDDRLGDFQPDREGEYPEPICLREITNHWGASDGCLQLLTDITRQFRRTTFLEGHNILDGLSYAGYQTLERNLCPACRDTVLPKIRTAILQNWDLLPSYFGLGTWEDIRKQQKLWGEAYDGNYS